MKKVSYTLNVRRDFVRAVRPSIEPLDGKTFLFRLGWLMGEGDPYPGEEAWIPIDPVWPDDAPKWIASGDLIKASIVKPYDTNQFSNLSNQAHGFDIPPTTKEI